VVCSLSSYRIGKDHRNYLDVVEPTFVK